MGDEIKPVEIQSVFPEKSDLNLTITHMSKWGSHKSFIF